MLYGGFYKIFRIVHGVEIRSKKHLKKIEVRTADEANSSNFRLNFPPIFPPMFVPPKLLTDFLLTFYGFLIDL